MRIGFLSECPMTLTQPLRDTSAHSPTYCYLVLSLVLPEEAQLLALSKCATERTRIAFRSPCPKPFNLLHSLSFLCLVAPIIRLSGAELRQAVVSER